MRLAVLNAVHTLPARRSAPPTACTGPDLSHRQLLEDLFEDLGHAIVCERNAPIFDEEEAANSVYLVVSGTVRICKFMEDGRRQIGGFHFAGDIFGFEYGARHAFCAEAVSACRLLVVRRTALMDAAARDAELGSALWMLANRELHRMNEHMVLLGRASAADRVMAFLRSVGERLQSPSVVEIPMSRQDMADHLGLNIETVSRMITHLRGEGAIALEGTRRIRLKDAALMAA